MRYDGHVPLILLEFGKAKGDKAEWKLEAWYNENLFHGGWNMVIPRLDGT